MLKQKNSESDPAELDQAAVARAVKLAERGAARAAPVDTLILTSEQRRTQRGTMLGSNGTRVEFDFPEPVALRTDDLLLLDNGDVVEVVAAPEPLIEVRADLATLARIAWALGDRHVPVQILPNRIRLRRDAALEPLVASLGGKSVHIEAPFDPEGGAYAAAHGHHHAHQDDGHGHAHHDHDHDGHEHGHHSHASSRGAYKDR